MSIAVLEIGANYKFGLSVWAILGFALFRDAGMPADRPRPAPALLSRWLRTPSPEQGALSVAPCCISRNGKLLP